MSEEKRKRGRPEKIIEPILGDTVIRRNRFFWGVTNPALVSQVVTTLACGIPLDVERLHPSLLLPVYLLATIGLNTYTQLIVTSFERLTERIIETYKMENVNMWHPEGFLVSHLVHRPPDAAYTLELIPECGYMFQVYLNLINEEIYTLFPGEPIDEEKLELDYDPVLKRRTGK